MDISVWGAVISTVLGIILTAVLYSSLTKAKVKSIIASTYDQLIATLTERIKILQDDVDRLRERLDHLSVKELQYLEQITVLTKERTSLQIQILQKDSEIEFLKRKQINPGT